MLLLKKQNILLLFLTILLNSCVSNKKLLYMQNTVSENKLGNYELTLKPDDVLMINVSSENPEIAAPYNLQSVSLVGNSENLTQTQRMQTYIIDQQGNIEFPMLGSIQLGGLKKSEALQKMKSLLKQHITDAVVTLRLLNYKISVLGEVSKPGVYEVNSERITLLEAIGKAGDLTVYGKRNTILVIREENGKTITNRVDLTKADFINSPFYYLQQNDVVYVEPNKTRVNSSAIGPNLTVGISALSLIVTIIALTVK